MPNSHVDRLSVAVGLAGGIAADVVISVTGGGPTNRRGTMLTLAISPLCPWSVYFLVIGLVGDLQWPPEIWGGAIVLTALSGLGLTALTQSPVVPADEMAMSPASPG